MKFDVWQSERALHDAGDVDETLRALDGKGYIERSDDAVWLKTTALWGDDKDRVVVKSDGLPTYLLADIAYHRKKLARGFDELADIWGSDHHGHIARMQAALKAFGFDPAVLSVILIQNVSLLRDGVEVKMGKRAGEFVTLDDVMDEVGRDATRYFYLMRRHDTPLEFDLEVAKRQSMDNPVYYVQYGHARCAAIRRRAVELEAARLPLDAGAGRRAGAARGDRDPAAAGRFPRLRGRRGRRARAPPGDDLPDRPGGRVPELLHPPAEGARRHHPAPGAPPDRRLAGHLELAQDGGPPLLGRRHRPGDAQRAGAAGGVRPRAHGARDGFGCRGPLSDERGRFMTVRYTAIDSMEESALRDVDRNAERWRDKIELRLDNRQVFFLFFGSAVVACMLFVLGVMVGKRIESRGQAASPELQDPLAALDRAHKPAAGVAAGAGAAADVPEHADCAAHGPEAEGGEGGVAPSRREREARAARRAAAKPVAPVAKPFAARGPEADRGGRRAASPPNADHAPAAPVPRQPSPSPAAAVRSGEGQGEVHAAPQHVRARPTRPRRSRSATRARSSSAATFPGRGLSYRVRYGNFPSYKDATSAKESFEKQHGTIALVAAR